MTYKLIHEYSQDLNILYVEDDKELAKKTKELFENYFKTVDVASNGKEGLDIYINYKEINGRPYDLLISDINMPLMNGIELSRNVLKLNPIQSIIIISAHNDSNYLMDAIDIGISGFLVKPIRHEHLSAVLYKVSMAIYDHKYVQNHLKTLEELNLQLERKNTQIEKSLRLLDTNAKHSPEHLCLISD